MENVYIAIAICVVAIVVILVLNRRLGFFKLGPLEVARHERGVSIEDSTAKRDIHATAKDGPVDIKRSISGLHIEAKS
ncbi:ABC-type enterobactin transport system permease subunit [Rhizobium ruizarguesonis]